LPQVKFSLSNCTEVFITDYELVPCLLKIKPIAPGLDALPSWIFSKCLYELAGIVAYIFDCSFVLQLYQNTGNSLITPVPKLSKPVCLANFRPISVMPIFSRLAEKLIVQKWLLPAINHQTINDQFAFRPTGSTMCALVFFMHHVLGYLKQILMFVVYLLIFLSLCCH